MKDVDYRAQVYAKARTALKRIKDRTKKSFEDWIETGNGVMMARQEAFSVCQTNDVKSGCYRRHYPSILKRENLYDDDLHPQIRKSVVAMMENLPAIEAWPGVPEHQRLMWNSPDAILRHWKDSFPKSMKAAKKPEAAGGYGAERMLADLAEADVKDYLDAKDLEIADLKRKLIAAYAEIDRLRQRLGIEPGPNDDLDDILPVFEIGLTLVALKDLGGEATEDQLKDRMWKLYDEAEDQLQFRIDMIKLGLSIEAERPH